MDIDAEAVQAVVHSLGKLEIQINEILETPISKRKKTVCMDFAENIQELLLELEEEV